MEAARDKLLRRFTIAATTVAAVVVLTADYGPQPHVFSSVSKLWEAGHNWLMTPTERELAELEQKRQLQARNSRTEKSGDN